MYKKLKEKFATELSLLRPVEIGAKIGTDDMEYSEFLMVIGYGPIGPGSFAISPSLRDFPDEWVLKDESLRNGFKLFADDLAGASFGFHLKYGRSVLIYDSADGVIKVYANSLSEWLEKCLGS